jgi:hypothetical protein
MSFRTYKDYNDDNVVKTIEETAREWGMRNKKEVNPMKKTLKDALLVYVKESLGNRARKVTITYEKLLTKRWFNWTTRVSITEDEFIKLLDSMNKDDYEVFYG